MTVTADELDSYGLFTAEAVQNPYPYYRRIREREPVHWSEKAQAWYFTVTMTSLSCRTGPT